MNNYKEIVTKAVVGKGKKTFRDDYELLIDNDVDTVLGCWVINHSLMGTNDNERVRILGSFDINIWYSYAGNTKTDVACKKISYEELVKVRLKEESLLTNDSEIIIRSLRNPVCVDVSSEDNKILYTIEKELGIEIIGDTKVKILIEPEEDDYDIIDDDENEEIDNLDGDVLKSIDAEVKEDYLSEEETSRIIDEELEKL